VPTWGEILGELNQTASPTTGGATDFDGVRRKYLAALRALTGRNVILYASAWLQNKPNASPAMLSIGGEDMHGLMETVHGLPGPSLDLILHSPGGEIEAAEGLVSYLRTKFSDIRIVVPGMAMSAATMMACAGNRILMGKHSFLGPIDPQFVINTATGPRQVAAFAILEQFELAKTECQDPSKLSAWLPMLSQYGPDFLVKSQLAINLSKSLVENWLASYMFAGVDDGPTKAAEISSWLCNHSDMKSHSRYLSRDTLEDHGLVIERLEDDQRLQDAVLSAFHAVNLTLSGTGAVRVIENHLGHAFLKQVAIPMIQFPGAVAPPQQQHP
jgi:hypothetical protein